MRTATITIHPAAITHNLNQVKKLAPNAKILAMVKANAYGHGVAAVLPALQQADGLGVATFAEALEARQLGWDKVIGLIEGVFCANEWQQAIDNDCSCVIHHAPQLDWALDNVPKADSPARQVWLKYNTGMNRLGFDENTIIEAAKQLQAAGYQLVLTTHFANADNRDHPLNAVQMQRFAAMLKILQETISADITGSLCNSAGIINFTDNHYDWVRPGIMLYGSSPVDDKEAADLNLLPAMDFSARIMAFQTLNAGDAVGYSSRWIAEKQTEIALVSIGYGDGYPRTIANNAYVCVITSNADNSSVSDTYTANIDGANTGSININPNIATEQSYACPILGLVAMDMIVIDISATAGDITLNSKVILWGAMPHVDEVAAHADTISYELLCRLSARPERTQV